MQENLNLVEGANIELIRTGDEVSINNTYEYDDSGIEAEIEQLEATLQNYSLITETGSKVQIELNNTNYKMKVKLLDKNDNVINTSNEIDLPIEQLVTSITYDSTTKELIFTLKDGTQTRVPLSDLISGLVTEDDFNESQEEQNETIEALKEKVEVYKTIFNALPHIEDEDTEMTLDDTANSVMEMTLKGNTSQYTTTGKNLLNARENSFTYQTSSTTLTENIGTINMIAGTTYYISYTQSKTLTSDTRNTPVIKHNGSRVYQNSNENANLTAGRKVWEYTPNETGDYTLEYWCHTPSQEVIISDFMISTNSDTTYEPYTNGASPNPDYPQPINVVSGDNTIEVVGKNIFDESQLLEATGWTSSNGVYSGEIGYYHTKFVNGFEGLIFEANTQYTISLKGYVNGGTPRVVIQYTDNTTEKIQIDALTMTSYTLTSTAGKTISVIKSDFGTGTTNMLYLTDFMIEKGTTATTYEPYQSQTYPINLGTLELCKIGDYQDLPFKAVDSDDFYKTLDSATKQTLTYGKWYLHKEIGKVVLDGTNYAFGSFYSADNNRGYINISNLKSLPYSTQLSYMDYFKFDGSVYFDSQNIVGYCNRNNSSGIMIRFGSASEINTQTKANNWLSTNNPIIYGVLATPTNTEITDTTLISQLEAVKNAVSYEGQTNVSQVNNDKAFIISASALKDLTNLESGE